ncbi:acetoin utilization protein AcuC [Kocuria flava]|uniref:acetoin utilization protein AcuC n=1 Tax=Kocuria flava TaxID=446860 RepID=UPI001FF1DF9F|nr:acetoin utilization protein AcuC [Kocuria flava]MCJ8503589.1 acetoin utilization protein AcuC [Kocuria flava]
MTSATTGGARPTRLYWDPALLEYNFGDHHPMHPSRLDVTYRLVQQFGLDRRDNVVVEAPEVVPDAVLNLVHPQSYVDAVRAVSADPAAERPGSGLGTEDTPAYPRAHEASARLVGGSYQGAAAILSGEAVRAVNFGGGMHHAHADRASGFCIYNDCAVAVQHLLDQGVRRVAYVDVDGHHGDGTQSIFYDDPRVMTISLHETGMTLFPGTGFANETGRGEAEGTAVNVALPSRADDAMWLRAFDAVVPPLLRQFRPEVLVTQHGCDSHFADELTHLRVSVDGQRQAALSLAGLADELCEGRWLATGGGGYNCHDVVPRSWTHLVGIVAGHPVAVGAAVPQPWREHVLATYGVEAPRTMGDDVDLWWRSWEVGFDPNDETDRTVMATRKEVFPTWGLDPWFD